MGSGAVEAFLDKQAIEEALLRYCRAVDRCDEDLLRSTYWEDAWDDHGLFVGDREGLLCWLMPYLQNELVSSVHTLGNVLIELVADDRAFSEAVFTGYYRVLRDGAPADRISCGRYIDLWEKRGGAWRILRRTVVNDWGRTDPVATEVTLRTPGTRNRDDPSYTLKQDYLRVPRRDGG